MYVACARIAAVNRPIAYSSDIFLPLPLLAASPDSQSRRVAILICSIHGAGSTGVFSSVLITFASGAYIWPYGKIKIQVASMECSPWRKGVIRRCIHLVYHHGSLCHERSPTVGGVPTWHHVGTYVCIYYDSSNFVECDVALSLRSWHALSYLSYLLSQPTSSSCPTRTYSPRPPQVIAAVFHVSDFFLNTFPVTIHTSIQPTCW